MRASWPIALLTGGCVKVTGGGEEGTTTTTGAADVSTGTGGLEEPGGVGDSGNVEFGGEESSGSSEDANGPCLGDDLLLESVAVDVVTNRILDADVPLAFDPAQGSYACLRFDDPWVEVHALLGPFDMRDPRTSLRLRVADGVRLYDLAVDPGPPAMGEPGLIRLGNNYRSTETQTHSFDTINQAGVGTVDVAALPVDGETALEFRAVGDVAAGGWVFDLRFRAVVPVAPEREW